MPLHQQLQAMLDTYVAAYRAGDGVGCAAIFAEDGVIFSGFAPPARGRSAIAALHQIWAQDGANKTLTVVQVAGSGDVAWCVAEFAEGHGTGEGHSLCACSRSKDGTWQVQTCSLTAA